MALLGMEDLRTYYSYSAIRVDTKLMDDWFELVLITFGAALGTILTYLGSIVFEKRQVNRRKRAVAGVLLSDLWWQLERLKTIRKLISNVIPNLSSNTKESKETIDSLSDFSSYGTKDTFSSLLSDISLLPSETSRSVIRFYNLAEGTFREIKRLLEAGKLENLDKAKTIAELIFNMGFNPYWKLVASEKNIAEDEAKKIAAKDFSQLKKEYSREELKDIFLKMTRGKTLENQK